MKTYLVDGQAFSLQEMLDANADDEGLCDWLAAAEVGERFPALVECIRTA